MASLSPAWGLFIRAEVVDDDDGDVDTYEYHLTKTLFQKKKLLLTESSSGFSERPPIASMFCTHIGMSQML